MHVALENSESNESLEAEFDSELFPLFVVQYIEVISI